MLRKQRLPAGLPRPPRGYLITHASACGGNYQKLNKQYEAQQKQKQKSKRLRKTITTTTVASRRQRKSCRRGTTTRVTSDSIILNCNAQSPTYITRLRIMPRPRLTVMCRLLLLIRMRSGIGEEKVFEEH